VTAFDLHAPHTELEVTSAPLHPRVGSTTELRGDFEFGVRRMQVERGHRGTPVVDIAVRPCGGYRFDAVEDDVLAGIRTAASAGPR